LVGRQEVHHKLDVGFVGGDVLTGAFIIIVIIIEDF